MEALRGAEGWEAARAAQFGEERWEALREALRRDVEHLALPNVFLPAEALAEVAEAYEFRETGLPSLYTFQVSEDPAQQFLAGEGGDEKTVFVQPLRQPGSQHWPWDLSPFVLLDGASGIAALALGAQEGETVLEVCAAPGARALFHAVAMFAGRLAIGSSGLGPRKSALPGGRLVCNEFSKAKAALLQRAMSDFLPSELMGTSQGTSPSIVITSADPSTPHNSFERLGPYDRILLAPACNADREMFREGAATMDRWSSGAIKVATEKQLKLLNNALHLLKDGGVLLYCVGALDIRECDGLIQRLMRSSLSTFELEAVPLGDLVRGATSDLDAEPTEWGLMFLPDRTPFGPLYLSKLRLVGRKDRAC